MNDNNLLGVTLYRTPAPQRLRAAAAAVHPHDPRLADLWLWFAREIEAHEYAPAARRQTKGITHATRY